MLGCIGDVQLGRRENIGEPPFTIAWNQKKRTDRSCPKSTAEGWEKNAARLRFDGGEGGSIPRWSRKKPLAYHGRERKKQLMKEKGYMNRKV